MEWTAGMLRTYDFGICQWHNSFPNKIHLTAKHARRSHLQEKSLQVWSATWGRGFHESISCMVMTSGTRTPEILLFFAEMLGSVRDVMNSLPLLRQLQSETSMVRQKHTAKIYKDQQLKNHETYQHSADGKCKRHVKTWVNKSMRTMRGPNSNRWRRDGRWSDVYSKNSGDGGEVDVQHRLIGLIVLLLFLWVKKDEGGDKDEAWLQWGYHSRYYPCTHIVISYDHDILVYFCHTLWLESTHCFLLASSFSVFRSTAVETVAIETKPMGPVNWFLLAIPNGFCILYTQNSHKSESLVRRTSHGFFQPKIRLFASSLPTSTFARWDEFKAQAKEVGRQLKQNPLLQIQYGIAMHSIWTSEVSCLKYHYQSVEEKHSLSSPRITFWMCLCSSTQLSSMGWWCLIFFALQ